jgi:hypothetical protein
MIPGTGKPKKGTQKGMHNQVLRVFSSLAMSYILFFVLLLPLSN